MKVKRIKNAQKSREDILKAAELEFAQKGFYGSRIDEIAERANINKRMIYEYFGNKEALYKTVLHDVYGRLCKKEVDLLSEQTSCINTIKNIIELYFNFLRDNPTYVNLILWENLNEGKYIEDVDFTGIKDPTLDLLRKVIIRGKSEGIFRENLNADQIILSLLTYSFSYFSNRYTLSRLLSMELENEENIRNRLLSVTEMLLLYICKEN